MIDFSSMKLIDLTDTLRSGMPVYPGDPEVQINQVLTIENDDESVFEFRMSSQSGTHLQSGFYFLPDGLTLDQIDPTSFFGWAKVIDVPSRRFDLNDIKHNLSNLQDVKFIILRSGYGEKLNQITKQDVNSQNRTRMKLDICDICYHKTDKITDRQITPSVYRISYKDGKGKRIALDTCKYHGDFFKKTKSFGEAEKKYQTLLVGTLEEKTELIAKYNL